MVKYLLHHEIDKERWDRCIERSSNGLICALSWYLDIVSPQWEAIVVLEGAEYTLCCPVPVRKKWHVEYIEHPHLCKQLGLFYVKPPEHAVVDEVFRALFTRYRYIPRLSFNVDNTLIWFSDPRVRIKEHAVYLLSLDISYPDLHKGYHRDRKYRLKQARSNNLRMVASQDIEPLIEIFERDTASKIPGGVYRRTYPNLRQLFKRITSMGKSELYYAYNADGDCLGGCWFILYKDTILYMFSGVLATARRENVSTLLIDHMIRRYQKTNYTFMFESAHHAGIDGFLKGFGGRITYYPSIYLNRLPSFWRKLHRAKILTHRKVISWQHPHRPLPIIELP